MRLLLVLLALGACTRGGERGRPDAGAAAPAAPRLSGFLPPAFAPPAGEGAPERGGEVTFGADAEPPSLNFMIDPDAWILRITRRTVYEALLRPTGSGYAPELAERHEVSADGRVHTFTIRSGVRWHDGKPFGVDDVRFTLDRLMDPKVRAAAQRSELGGLEKWEVVDRSTLRLVFDRPRATHLQALAGLHVLPRHVFQTGDLNRHPANRAPVGTGPFRFERWTPQREIVLARWDGYWDAARAAHLDRVAFRFQRDRTLLWQLLRKGEVDFLYRLLPDQQVEVHESPDFARGKGFRYLDWLGTDYVFFLYNLRRPYLADRRARQALTMLMNRQAYVPKVTRGFARLITGPHWSATPAYDETIPPWPHDPARAEALLDELGWRRGPDGVRARDGVRFQFGLLVPAGSRVTEQLATLVQQDLKRAGIVMELAPIDWSVFGERVRKHAFDATAYLLNNDLEQDVYDVFHSSQSEDGLNAGFFADPEVDRLLEQIRGTLDAGARNALQRRLHRLLHEAQPMTFWFTSAQTAVYSDRLRGVYPSVPFFPVRDMWIPKALQKGGAR